MNGIVIDSVLAAQIEGKGTFKDSYIELDQYLKDNKIADLSFNADLSRCYIKTNEVDVRGLKYINSMSVMCYERHGRVYLNKRSLESQEEFRRKELEGVRVSGDELRKKYLGIRDKIYSA